METPTCPPSGPDSCSALSALCENVDAFMANTLDAAMAVKREQEIDDNAEAFDYMASFLSGAYRALALCVRETTIEAME